MPKSIRPATLIRLVSLAALIFLTGLIIYLLQPTVLTIAVDEQGNRRLQLINALAEKLEKTQVPIRLKILLTHSLSDSSDAVDNHLADLAFAHSLDMPATGQTIAILQRNPVLFIAARSQHITKVVDLKNKRLGMTEQSPLNMPLLQKILAQDNLTLNDVKLVHVPIEKVSTMISNKKIDAMLVTIPIQGAYFQHTMQNIRKTQKVEPIIFGVSDADAIIQRYPMLESYEIKKGVFSSKPMQPAEDLTTLSYSERLTARSSLDINNAADVTRLLFTLKPALALHFPSANAIESLDPDEAAKFDLHPGARAWYAGEQKSPLERYSDVAYAGVTVATGLASVIGALASYFARRRQQQAALFVRKAEGLLAEIRNATTLVALKEILERADLLFVQALQKAGKGEINAEQFAMFSAVNQHINAAAQQCTLELPLEHSAENHSARS